MRETGQRVTDRHRVREVMNERENACVCESENECVRETPSENENK